MSNELEQIKVQLDEKDQLVDALTTRLEQAAEQLDRIRRTGSDRTIKVAGGSGGGSLSPEFLDQQKQISDDIQNMSVQWTEMETTGSIARIEHQIGDVRDLIIDLCQKQQTFFENGVPSGAYNSVPEDVSSFLNQLEETKSPEASDPEETNTEEEISSEATGFDFNALKNSLLNNDPDDAENKFENQIADVVQDINNTNPVSSPPVSAPEESIEEVTAPQDIQFKGASQEQLCEAIEQRDTYITYLLRKLRLSQTLQISLPDWESLEGTPEELLKEAHSLSVQLNEQLRLAEVENAVERARLGREANRLQQLQQKMDKVRHQQKEEESLDNEDDSEQGSSRWMKMLSRNRKQNSDEE
jgi:hypothetical protein